MASQRGKALGSSVVERICGLRRGGFLSSKKRDKNRGWTPTFLQCDPRASDTNDLHRGDAHSYPLRQEGTVLQSTTVQLLFRRRAVRSFWEVEPPRQSGEDAFTIPVEPNLMIIIILLIVKMGEMVSRRTVRSRGDGCEFYCYQYSRIVTRYQNGILINSINILRIKKQAEVTV